jgi:hypothetical protein
VEGVLKSKVAAIIQQSEGWCGVMFDIKKNIIGNLSFVTGQSFDETKKFIGDNTFGLALNNGSAFLFHLPFPFSGTNKIRMILGNELAQKLPVPVDEMRIDFLENGKGNVLAAALPKNFVTDFHLNRQSKIVTVQCLAALYALKWLKWIEDDNFVFMHMCGNAVVVMAYKEGYLFYLRQFFHSRESDSFDDAIDYVANRSDFMPKSFILIGDSDQVDVEKKRLQDKFHIVIERPSVSHFIPHTDLPEWGWAAIGAGLMSLKPKGHINLLENKSSISLLSSEKAVYFSVAVAILGLLLCGLSYLNYTLKNRTLNYLMTEPGRIYKTTFPKSPPIKDPIAVFREKMRNLDKQPGSISTINSPLGILNEMSIRIPSDLDVKIDDFTFDEKEVSLSGTTISFAAAEKVRSFMEQIEGISQVEIQTLELIGNKQIKFKLKGRL